ncbi:putative protein TPRXL [Zingiber officinale]|uniref:putative protein TPRXL n=1 Tax=Zingiber officinale TaxID=94328 RepID=UPI001C4DC10B|nr:putative protein TPRXL [Zingiber officinale]
MGLRSTLEECILQPSLVGNYVTAPAPPPSISPSAPSPPVASSSGPMPSTSSTSSTSSAPSSTSSVDATAPSPSCSSTPSPLRIREKEASRESGKKRRDWEVAGGGSLFGSDHSNENGKNNSDSRCHDHGVVKSSHLFRFTSDFLYYAEVVAPTAGNDGEQAVGVI